jgi:hypothetical protein
VGSAGIDVLVRDAEGNFMTLLPPPVRPDLIEAALDEVERVALVNGELSLAGHEGDILQGLLGVDFEFVVRDIGDLLPDRVLDLVQTSAAQAVIELRTPVGLAQDTVHERSIDLVLGRWDLNFAPRLIRPRLGWRRVIHRDGLP